MATANFSVRSECYISATFVEVSTSPTTNASTFRANFSVIGNGTTHSADTLDAVIQFYYKVDGGTPVYLTNTTFTFDFRNGNPVYLTNYDVSITHRANGSQTVVFGATARDGNTGNYRELGIATIGDTAVTVTDFVRLPDAPATCTAAIVGSNIQVTSGTSTSPVTVSGYWVQSASDADAYATWSTEQLMTSQSYTYTTLTRGRNYKFRVYAKSTEGTGPSTMSTALFYPAGGKRYDGTSYVATATAKRYDGSAFVQLTTAKRYDGTAWVNLS